jgi:ankyrin repeat protein
MDTTLLRRWFAVVVVSFVAMIKSGDCSAAKNSLKLISAAANGDVAEVDRLIAHGADPNSHTKLEFALGEAAFAGHLDVVQILIAHGANVEFSSSDLGFTALKIAAAGGRTEIVSYLLGHGADVNSTDAMGWTALGFAFTNGHSDVEAVLRSHGADKLADIVNHKAWLLSWYRDVIKTALKASANDFDPLKGDQYRDPVFTDGPT